MELIYEDWGYVLEGHEGKRSVRVYKKENKKYLVEKRQYAMTPEYTKEEIYDDKETAMKEAISYLS